MRIAALVLSLVAALPATLEAGGLGATALSRAFFGATNVCAAGGPECRTAVAEPADFVGFLPYFALFALVAIGSFAGGLVTLRRPRTGAVLLLIVGVVGAATILFFIPPIWTVLDLIAAGLAFASSRQRRPVAVPQAEPKP
jgi:hypothetical protein